MPNKFEGPDGQASLVKAMLNQKLVSGDRLLAEAISKKLRVKSVGGGEMIIEQGASDNNVFLIVEGTFDIVVSGKVVNQRGAGDHIGEMAAIEPGQPRSATVMATDQAVVAVLTATDLHDLAKVYPEVYLRMARELSQRLLQRQNHVGYV